MPYISLDNLTQYNGRLRDYIDGSFDKLDGANWRKTSAGQSVSCWPIPESPLEPEVTFKFSETPPESGTKGPDNPSTIVGVESVSCHVCESEGVDETQYTIDLGGTYYGGTVNFATGVLEVTWEAYKCTGSSSEGWFLDTANSTSTMNYFRCVPQITHMMGNGSVATRACTHFVYSSTSSVVPSFATWSQTPRIVFRLPSASFPDVATLTSWLASEYNAGHPVTVAYALDQPYTVPLTPVLVRSLPALSHYAPRQNTIYTPHESVQVGYAKSASKTSQDLVNAIVALGGNV